MNENVTRVEHARPQMVAMTREHFEAALDEARDMGREEVSPLAAMFVWMGLGFIVGLAIGLFIGLL